MSSADRSPTLSTTRNLVFDLDGTLIDSGPGIASAVSAAFRAIGKPLEQQGLQQRIRDVIGPPIGVMAHRLEPSLTEPEVAAIERVFRHSYDTDTWRETVAFPGVPDTLRHLQATGYPLYIVTNKPLIPTTAIMKLLGIENLVTAVLTRDTPRPHHASKAAMLADLLSIHHLESHATLLTGDTLEDSEAAAANSVAFVHAAYGYGYLPEAAHAISSFSHLLEFL